MSTTIIGNAINGQKTTGKRHFHWSVFLVGAMVVLLLAIGMWMRLYDLGVPFDRDSYDEGVYWQSLRALSAGHTLYQQIFYSQPPFFLLSVFPTYLLFGQTIWAARLGIALLSLLGLLGALLLGKALAGRIGMLAALLLLLVSPQFLSESQILQAEAPSTALALLAVGLAYLWWETPNGPIGLALAALTALTLALGILSKFFALVELLPIGLLMLAHLWRIFTFRLPYAARQGGSRPLLLGVAVFILTMLLVLLPFAGSFAQMWQGMVTFHMDASRVLAYSRAGNRAMLENFLLGSPIAYAALLGTILALLRRDWRVLPLIAWFGATAIMLWRYAPLFPHHLVVLVPPLVALAVMGIGPLKLPGKRAKLLAHLPSALSVVAILIVAALTAQADISFYHAIEAQAVSQGTRADLQVAQELQQALQPGQLVITDAQFLAAEADRDTPPSLVDTSNVRIQTGYVTTPQLIQQAEQPEVHAILFYSGRLASQTAFHTWVRQHFRLAHNYGGGRELWLR